MNDVPTHYWQGDKTWVTIYRKTSLYGAEAICQVLAGTLSSPNKDTDCRDLANALCEYLESRKSQSPGDTK